MHPQRFQTIRDLFAQARQHHTGERDAFLRNACGDDAELRREVEALLATADESTLAAPGLSNPGTTDMAPGEADRLVGTRIGAYKLLELLGEGGFGAVYVAEQDKPVRRKVALKLIKLGMDTRQVIARFEAERQALAMMDHPNIARVLDAGVTGGPPEPRAETEPRATTEPRAEASGPAGGGKVGTWEGGKGAAARGPERMQPGAAAVHGAAVRRSDAIHAHYYPAGRPWFAMELVRGVPITQYCDAANLTAAERLALFIPVCHAVQHAHQKGVIHRDIKPGNVLVTLHDGKPVPKVIDFGIAKAIGAQLTDKTLHTLHRQAVGTPAYMAPEQAEMSGLDVDTRADIYSLGVLLYELLTGAPPFSPQELLRAGWAEMQRIIREVEPPKPSTRVNTLGDTLPSIAARRRVEPKRLGMLLRGDIDWIAMKCLEKDRGRRYATANDLATDVQRHLSGEPIVAAPPSVGYRLRKFVRKHRGQVIAAALVSAALLLGIIGTSWGLGWALREQARTSAAFEREQSTRAEAQESAYIANIALAQGAIARAAWPQAREYLARCLRELRGFEWKLLNQEARSTLLEFPGARSIDMSPDGSRVLTTFPNSVRLWDATTGQPVCDSLAQPDGVNSAVLSPDGTRVLTVGPNCMLFDAARGTMTELPPICFATFSPDGRRFLISSSTTTSDLVLMGFVWSTGKPTCEIRDSETGKLQGEQILLEDYLSDCTFSPDGRRILIASGKTARQWDAATGQPIGEPMQHNDSVYSAVFSPDGTRVLTEAVDNRALWDAVTGQPIGEPMRRKCFAYLTAFSPDGTRALTAFCNEVRQWDAATGQPIGEPMKHNDFVCSAVFSPDGKRVLAESVDHTAHIWDASTGQPIGEPMKHNDSISSVVFSPDGTRVLTSCNDNTVRLWDATSGRQIGARCFSLPGCCGEFSHDGERITIARPEMDMPLECWILDAGEFTSAQSQLSGDPLVLNLELAVLFGARRSAVPPSVMWQDADAASANGMEGDAVATAVSPDSSRRVVSTTEGRLRFLSRRSAGDQSRELAVFTLPAAARALRFTPDGTRLVLWLANGEVDVWDTRDAAARSADLGRRWDERQLAKPWVNELLDGPQSMAEIERTISTSAAHTPLRRLGAAEELRWQQQEIARAADNALESLQKEQVTPARVLAAAEHWQPVGSAVRTAPLSAHTGNGPYNENGPHSGPYGEADRHPRRVREALIAKAREWKPDASALNQLAWPVVRDPNSPPDRAAAALEAAEEAARLSPANASIINTLGVAQCRAGRYESALQSLGQSKELYAKAGEPRPSDAAFIAMSHFKLGHVAEARAVLTNLRELMEASENAEDEESVAFLREAEALIDPPGSQSSSQPASQPTTQPTLTPAEASETHTVGGDR